MHLRIVALCLCLGTLANAELSAPFPLADVPILIAEVKKPDLTIGKKADDDSTAKKIDLKQYRGKALVVIMISTTCKHCITAVEALINMQREFGPQGLQVVGLSGDENASVALLAFMDQFHPNFPFGYLRKDPFLKLANLPPDGRPFVPVVLFVDPKGMVRNRMFGNEPAMLNTDMALRQGVKDLLAKSAPLMKK